jgi:hypothetical protein
MNVKRFMNLDEPEPVIRVDAADYDALLAVLRQCVGCMERLEDPRSNSFKKALAAARPYIERKEGEK